MQLAFLSSLFVFICVVCAFLWCFFVVSCVASFEGPRCVPPPPSPARTALRPVPAPVLVAPRAPVAPPRVVAPPPPRVVAPPPPPPKPFTIPCCDPDPKVRGGLDGGGIGGLCAGGLSLPGVFVVCLPRGRSLARRTHPHPGNNANVCVVFRFISPVPRPLLFFSSPNRTPCRTTDHPVRGHLF